MPTMEDVAKQTREQRVARLTRTADDLAAAIRGQSEEALSRRPDTKNWAAKEVVCHLRDTEELFMERFQMILAMDEPKLSGLNPDRWADERQYLRNDVNGALAAFRKRRDESLDFLAKLPSDAWRRAGVHATRGKFTLEDFVILMTWHDDNHLDQLERALEGRV
jgi:uncharacterized damage-inducible protein DinB